MNMNKIKSGLTLLRYCFSIIGNKYKQNIVPESKNKNPNIAAAEEQCFFIVSYTNVKSNAAERFYLCEIMFVHCYY
jgi:hypothetical protein